MIASIASSGVLAAAYAQAEGPRNEFFTGFEASENYTSVYVGGGYAFGKGLYTPGWRLRSVASYGRYHYDDALLVGDDLWPIRFEGEAYFVSFLAGYQFHPGPLIVKIFAGLESNSQAITPRDPNNDVQGSRLGLRLQAEGWYDISPRLYLSTDIAYGTAFESYRTLTRLGFRVKPKLSLGIEGGAHGNAEYDAGRGGGFARVNLYKTEVTLSGGFTGSYLEDEPSGYVALGLYRAF
jgi:Cellulose biosynthesis protein BcsS